MTPAAAHAPASRFFRPALHLGGMMLAAAANPLIKHDTLPVFVWVSTWLTPLIVASVAFGLYFLIARKRARATWPHGFFVTAWVLVAIILATPYIQKAQQGQAAPAPRPVASGEPAPAAVQFDPSTARPDTAAAAGHENPFRDPNYGKELLQKQQ